jgi:FAD/FMN-containing dehydrogenase
LDPVARLRIRDDLRGLLRGELLFDDLSRALYSTDASPFLVEPLGVAVPRDAEDVQTLVRYAGDHSVSLIPRGAGTGVAGEALGAGLIVDLSKHFRSILEVGSDRVRVQPGVILRDLGQRLAQEGRRFAPDPSQTDCTLGGMLATNASGARAILHGTTRDHVQQLEVVLDTGERVEVGREGRRPTEKTASRLVDLVGGVATLLEQHAGLIQAHPSRTRFDRCGYAIHDTLGPDHLDLARLLVGSEGTLALFTAATLKTIPLAGGRASVLLAFPTLDGALRAALQAGSTGPAACELLDRRLLRLAREADPDVAALVAPSAEAVLLVEFEADTPDSAARAAALLAGRCGRGERLPGVQLAAGEDEVSRFWRVRDAALPGLDTLRGGTRPLPFVEDVAVPPPVLGDYLRRVQEILQQHELTASFLIHAATGQVHMRPFMDTQLPGEPGRMWLLADEVYGLVLEFGGTITAQHGTGLARSPWVPRQAGPLYPVYRDLKALFDPRGLFNPGKIVGAPSGHVWPMRPPRDVYPAVAPPVEENPAEAEPKVEVSRVRTALNWAPGTITSEVLSCTGCGECRTTAPGRRMCPVFRATHDEAATPRAK